MSDVERGHFNIVDKREADDGETHLMITEKLVSNFKNEDLFEGWAGLEVKLGRKVLLGNIRNTSNYTCYLMSSLNHWPNGRETGGSFLLIRYRFPSTQTDKHRGDIPCRFCPRIGQASECFLRDEKVTIPVRKFTRLKKYPPADLRFPSINNRSPQERLSSVPTMSIGCITKLNDFLKWYHLM